MDEKNIKFDEHLKEVYSDKEMKADMLSEAWQKPGLLVHPNTSFFSIHNESEKEIGGNLFAIKEHCKKSFRESPYVGSIINRFSSWIWGENSFLYSDYEFLQDFLDNFFSDWFNDLDTGISEIVLNLLVDGEVFLLITVLNLNGDMRIRFVEDKQIRGGKDDYGIITDPDDISVTAFYIVETSTSSTKTASQTKRRLIPDINVLWNPSLYSKLKENGAVNGFNDRLTAGAKWTGAGKKMFKQKTGTPFKQFIVPWKNLMGIKNQRRSVSAIRRVISATNKYNEMLDWSRDFFKAMMSYTDVFEFSEDRLGVMAFNWIVQKMKTEAGRKELYNAGITKPKMPGDTVITRPGMTYKKVAPQISAPPMTGYFKDYFHMITAGLETPADLATGDSSGSTQASLKMSRQAPNLSVNFVQWRLQLYLRTRLMRSIFKIKSALDDSFPAEIEVDQFFLDKTTGKPKRIKRKLPLWHEQILKINLPDVNLGDDDKKAKAWFGSKHLGASDELGLSQEKTAKKFDIGDYSKQKRERLLEDEIYGKKEIVKDKESFSEKQGTLGEREETE